MSNASDMGEVANRRHLANTTERFVLGGVAALTCYDVSVQVACVHTAKSVWSPAVRLGTVAGSSQRRQKSI